MSADTTMPSPDDPPSDQGWPTWRGHRVNLAGEYRYMEEGYYASQECELGAVPVVPTQEEALDAYIPPLALERACQAGIAIPDHYLSHGWFEPPAVVDAVNPFMERRAVVRREGGRERVARSLTRNFTYPILVQSLPSGARLATFRLVLDWTASERYREWAPKIWDCFHIPLARVDWIRTAAGDLLFSRIRPLPLERLTPREHDHLRRSLEWPA